MTIREESKFAELSRIVLAHMLVDLRGTRKAASDILSSSNFSERRAIETRFDLRSQPIKI